MSAGSKGIGCPTNDRSLTGNPPKIGASGILVASYSLFIVGGWIRTDLKASRTFWVKTGIIGTYGTIL